MRYFDLHCDAATELFDKHQSLDKNDLHFDIVKAQNIGAVTQIFAIYRNFDDIYNNFIAEAAKNADVFALCKSRSDLTKARKQNKVCGVLSLEGADPLDGDPANLKDFYQKGIRSLSFTWNTDTAFAGCHITGNGMTPAGYGLLH